jgi:hypothetical protein
MFQHTRFTSLVVLTALALAACGEGVFTESTGTGPAKTPGETGRRTQELSEDRRYIVTFEGGAPELGLTFLLAAGANVARELKSIDAVAVYLDDDAALALAADPRVAAIEPDRRRAVTGLPSSGNQVTPYGIDMVQAPQVWADADGSGITVCVIDSGLDVGHESMQTTGLSGSPTGWDHDGCGHGTHVAGTIAAVDNGAGVVGVIPGGVKMHNVKVFGNGCGWSYASDLIHAVEDCRNAGADVVNMSLGGSWPSAAEAQAFQAIYDAGVLLVAAAGNDGTSTYSYPASYDAVVSVAALDANENRASFSQYNDQVELAAPGVAVMSATPMDGCALCASPAYEAWDGTSMATPHVAGVAALVWSYNRAWTNQEIRTALQMSARDLGAPGRNTHYGYGLVQARDALDFLIGQSCLETGCDTGEVCNEDTLACEIPPVMLALYDFEGASKSPAETDASVYAGTFDNRDGDAGFVAGLPGEAITATRWRDADENYFSFLLVPGDEAQVRITGITFDERPSGTGPTDFDILVVGGDEAVFAGAGETVANSWRFQAVSFDAAARGPHRGAVEVRIAGRGASSSVGTWRLDNVRVTGVVEPRDTPPSFVSVPPTTVQAGEAYSYTVVATGSPEPTISVGALPYWLEFDGIRTLSGVAPSFAVGDANEITVTAFNGAEPSATQTFTVDVVPAPAVPLAGAPIIEDFGNGLPAGWFASGSWEVGVPTSGPHAAYEGFAVAATALAGNYSVPNQSLLSPPTLDLSGMDDAVLRFQSWHAVDGCWHGVNLLFSTDGGATFSELPSAAVSPAYDGTVAEYDGAIHAPNAGQQAWCNSSDGWRAVAIDLEAGLAGRPRDQVVILFQLGADSIGPNPGWYVDAVRLGSAADLSEGTEPPPLSTLAFFDFEVDVKTPAQTAAGIFVGSFDNRDGDGRFVIGNPGRAITDNGWRDDDLNYYAFEVVPEAGRSVEISGLAFDERASGTGPLWFEVRVIQGYSVVWTDWAYFEPGSWGHHSLVTSGIDFDAPFEVRILAGGASSGAGTWRLDNVRLTGWVH